MLFNIHDVLASVLVDLLVNLLYFLYPSRIASILGKLLKWIDLFNNQLSLNLDLLWLEMGIILQVDLLVNLQVDLLVNLFSFLYPSLEYFHAWSVA